MRNHNQTILDLFKKALVNQPNDRKISFKEMNKETMLSGYLVPEQLCLSSVYDWIETQSIDTSTTFYKSWNDVLTKNRFELLVDQLLHYISTYGTGFTGAPYLQNQGIEVPSFTDFKVIEEITIDELTQKVCDMLYSGIALKDTTVMHLVELVEELKLSINIDKVRNREAKNILISKLGIYPSNPEDMVRYLVFNITGESLVIKNKKLIAMIKSQMKDISKMLDKYGLEKLAEVFFRYKPLFLAMKSNKNTSHMINKIRRLADRYHKPYKFGYFENILSLDKIPDNLEYKLTELNNFKKLTLLQTILIRMKNIGIRAFIIRNGKLFIKDGNVSNKSEYYTKLYSKIYKSLTLSLASKACSIKLPENINLKVPTSEKSFIGEYPIGSYVKLGNEDVIVGIYWHENDGARDIDLSGETLNGQRIGWNSSYSNNDKSIVYSGDVTSAPEGATELLYGCNGFESAIIKCNLYGRNEWRYDNKSNNKSDCKFKFFVAKDKIKPSRNFMVDPNKIVYQTELSFDESNEKAIGLIFDNKFIFANLSVGNKRVSSNDKRGKDTITYFKESLNCYLDLYEVLEDSGFTFTNNNPDIDLTNLDKSSLISLIKSTTTIPIDSDL